MFKKFLPILFLVLPACSFGTAAIDDTCENLEEASKMTYDCKAMATKLSKYIKVLDKQIRNGEYISAHDPLKYIHAFSPCLQALDEIRYGVCGNDPDIQKAFASVNNNNP